MAQRTRRCLCVLRAIVLSVSEDVMRRLSILIAVLCGAVISCSLLLAEKAAEKFHLRLGQDGITGSTVPVSRLRENESMLRHEILFYRARLLGRGT